MLSFLGLILERIDYDNYEHLIEEGKDPVELLHYKFQHIPSDVIDSVIAIDPTKKKSYSQWLLNKWDEESDTIINNLKNGRIAKLFQHYKEHQDIQIKDCPSVEEGLREFVPEEDTVLTKSTNPTTTLMNRGWMEEVPSELANDFNIVFNEDDWIIAVPNTYEADCKLGENMNWCTAGGRSDFEGGRRYYDNYLNSYGGKYYVNFDMSQGESRLGKDYPYTRYQFHFESNQFMDKEDDPVELCEIGMPDSAKEFYSNEGYDADKFENLEARIERYEEQRSNSYYALSDDLYLNVAYNEEYEYEEPNEHTDFYLFSDDDRDPISWEEVPNPFIDEDTVILKSNWFCILKKKYGRTDDSVLIAINVNNSGWSRWEAYTFGKYMILPHDIGIFGANDNAGYSLISSNNSFDFDKLNVSECENIFINEQCTNADADNWNQMFIETVADGYHSLFAISHNNGTIDDCEIIIKRDIPVNGKYFVINENWLIDGTFRSYRVYDDDFYGGKDTNPNYDLEQLLPTGDYLVSAIEQGEYNGKEKQVFNILKKGNMRKPIIEPWFDEYIAYSKNLYGVKKDEKFGFFTISNGKQVGRWYDSYYGFDQENDIIIGKVGNLRFGSQEQADIINGEQGSVTATFTDILSRKPANNKVIVVDRDRQTTKVFDYIENKFYFPELNGFLRIDQYDHPYLFACSIGNTSEKGLFDLKSLQVLVRGIKQFNKMSRIDVNYVKLTKMNGKVNVFDTNNLTQVIQNDVDEIIGMNEYTSILVYVINGKYFPLNYKTGEIMINPNGIGVPTYVNGSDKIFCSTRNYNIYFVPNSGLDQYKFYSWQNKQSYGDYGTNFDPQNTPQEVLEAYNLIFGQQESITRNFKNYVNRINEAMKYRYNDLVD